MRWAIEKPEGDLTEADLWQVTGLDFTSQNLTDLGLLAGLVKLKKLYLFVNRIDDPSPLAGLKDLVVVTLADNPITRAQADQLQKALPKCEV